MISVVLSITSLLQVFLEQRGAAATAETSCGIAFHSDDRRRIWEERGARLVELVLQHESERLPWPSLVIS
jgi:hypothetical protein